MKCLGWLIPRSTLKLLQVILQNGIMNEFKGGSGFCFDPCVNNMGGWPFDESHMEASYLTAKFGSCTHYHHLMFYCAIS